MSTTRPIEQVSASEFRRDLIDLLWKSGLLVSVPVLFYQATQLKISPTLFVLPVVWIVASLACWQLVRRDRDQDAAWVFLVASATALCFPYFFGSASASSILVMQSLPFCFPLLVSLAGLLLPAWGMLLLLGMQGVATLLAPLVFGSTVAPLYGVAFVLTMLSIVMVWVTSRPLFQIVERATTISQRSEEQVRLLDRSRVEL
ncbi:MAG: hypothetical protein JXA89_27915, partial [Anaerolineae bacterium]|nr:hypothetical protein [Anaerolineae bacterium]